MAADTIEMQEIARLLTTELRPKVDAVQQTEAWTREGKRARFRLKQFLAELRGLAMASGQECAIDGVKKVRLFILGNVMRPEELPNWDCGDIRQRHPLINQNCENGNCTDCGQLEQPVNHK